MPKPVSAPTSDWRRRSKDCWAAIAGGRINPQHLSVKGINQLSAKSTNIFLWPDNAIGQGLWSKTARLSATSVSSLPTSPVSAR